MKKNLVKATIRFKLILTTVIINKSNHYEVKKRAVFQQ